MTVRLEINDPKLKERIERVVQPLGETDLCVRAYPHPHSFPPASGAVAALITDPSGMSQAVAEEVDALLFVELEINLVFV